MSTHFLHASGFALKGLQYDAHSLITAATSSFGQTGLHRSAISIFGSSSIAFFSSCAFASGSGSGLFAIISAASTAAFWARRSLSAALTSARSASAFTFGLLLVAALAASLSACSAAFSACFSAFLAPRITAAEALSAATVAFLLMLLNSESKLSKSLFPGLRRLAASMGSARAAIATSLNIFGFSAWGGEGRFRVRTPWSFSHNKSPPRCVFTCVTPSARQHHHQRYVMY